MEHSFNIFFAKKYGLDAAILHSLMTRLQQDPHSEDVIHNRKVYFIMRYKNIECFLPFWSKKKIGKLVCKLIDAGLIERITTGDPNHHNIYAYFVNETI